MGVLFPPPPPKGQAEKAAGGGLPFCKGCLGCGARNQLRPGLSLICSGEKEQKKEAEFITEKVWRIHYGPVPGLEREKSFKVVNEEPLQGGQKQKAKYRLYIG